LRAIGENPEAADAAGLSIYLYRFAAVIGGSALVGLAGGYLSVGSAKFGSRG
jgi:general nucleoside transport system permease protein